MKWKHCFLLKCASQVCFTSLSVRSSLARAVNKIKFWEIMGLLTDFDLSFASSSFQKRQLCQVSPNSFSRSLWTRRQSTVLVLDCLFEETRHLGFYSGLLTGSGIGTQEFLPVLLAKFPLPCLA